MADWKVNKLTGDLDLTNGEVTMLTGSDSKAQRVNIKLKINKGEWFADTGFGVPYTDGKFGGLLGSKPRTQTVAAIYREQILSIPEPDKIEGVRNMEVSYDGPTREMSVSFTEASDEDDSLDFNSTFPIG